MRRVVLILLVALPAFAKSLHWSAIDVRAHLDGQARLHVLERQTMVFDGDWNGGERDFNVRAGQKLTLNRIARIDGGREIELHPGLEDVDGYGWHRDGVLRWRSRKISDPEFANQTIEYLLDYTWSDIMLRDGDAFVLSHDFGLPKRDGEIEVFTLHLDFDPHWQHAPLDATRTHLAPGQTITVNTTLHWRGAGAPQGRPMLARWVPPALAATFLVVAIFLIIRFVVEERARGRFAPVETRLDEALLKMPAEVVGAAWDDDIGADEVSAVLARMTQEGKLATHAEGKTLQLRLKVKRGELRGYERDLIDALFFDGGDHTNTDLIRAHYKSSGFDPAKKIAPGITIEVNAIPELASTESRTPRGLLALVVILGIAAVAAVAWRRPEERIIAFISLFVAAFATLFAAALAVASSKKVTGFVSMWLAPAIPYALGAIPVVGAFRTARRWGYDAPLLLALMLLQLAIFYLVIELMKTRDLPVRIAFRKRLAGTRAYFVRELAGEHPALRDEWFPYVLAFGLSKNADRWFRSYGSTSSTTSSSWSSSSSSASSSSASSWSGGGGAFGGAGASGSWAVAASAMAAGVSRPSSSGGGGSSSGGGGGGGW